MTRPVGWPGRGDSFVRPSFTRTQNPFNLMDPPCLEASRRCGAPALASSAPLRGSNQMGWVQNGGNRCFVTLGGRRRFSMASFNAGALAPLISDLRKRRGGRIVVCGRHYNLTISSVLEGVPLASSPALRDAGRRRLPCPRFTRIGRSERTPLQGLRDLRGRPSPWDPVGAHFQCARSRGSAKSLAAMGLPAVSRGAPSARVSSAALGWAGGLASPSCSSSSAWACTGGEAPGCSGP